MLPELGQIALILALLVAALQAALPLLGAQRGIAPLDGSRASRGVCAAGAGGRPRSRC